MKTFLFLLSAFAILFASCKKDVPDNPPESDETCKLPLETHEEYFLNGQFYYSLNGRYTYSGRNYDRTDWTFQHYSGNTIHFHYEFIYDNPEKGLLNRRNFYEGTHLNSYRLYTYQNDKLIRIEQLDGSTDTLELRFDFTYDANGLLKTSRKINRSDGSDITRFYTFDDNGENVTEIILYNTADLSKPIKAYLYEYDDHPNPYSKVNTKSWPYINKNNFIRITKFIYSDGTIIDQVNYLYDITYDKDGYPENKVEKTSNGDILYQAELSYQECD